MTNNEKRFIYLNKTTVISNGHLIGMKEIVECLNNLYEENISLKTRNGELEDYLARIEEENKELQKR